MTDPMQVKQRLMRLAREVEGLSWADRKCIGEAIALIDAPSEDAPVATTAQVQEDAARYRWLRSIDSSAEWNRMGHYADMALDKQVDAARQASSGWAG